MRKFVRHTVFWISYLLFKTLLNITADPNLSVPFEEWVRLFSIHFLAQLSFLLVKIPLVYVFLNVIDEYFGNRLSMFKALTISGSAFLIAIPIFNLVNVFVTIPILYQDTNQDWLMFDIGSMLYYAFNLASVVGIASTVKLIQKQFFSKIHQQTLEKEKIETELKYLKGQINPHFLFNTLNNIYALARKQSDQTAESVLKLSKLMRFMLYDASSEQILVTDEIKLIEDYIALERLRYSDRLQISFKAEIDSPDTRIAPLLLIHFVENAFKHGAGESRFQSVINIEIVLKNDCLQATIENTKGESSREGQIQIGLENIRRQLELLYPQHSLTINEDETTFRVDLLIPKISKE